MGLAAGAVAGGGLVALAGGEIDADYGEALADALRTALAAQADPVRAEGQQRYMKSAMPYYGVTTPVVRAVVRDAVAVHPLVTRPQWLRAVRLIWDGAGRREERYAAIGVLQHRRYRAWACVADDDLLALLRHLIMTLCENNSPAELQMLGIYCSQHGNRGAEVLTRVRRFLVEHLSGARCADNVQTATGKQLPLPQSVSEFNQLIALNQYSIEEITEDEIKLGVLGGKAIIPAYWSTPKAARMKQRYAEVMFEQHVKEATPNAPRVITRTVPASAEQRGTPDRQRAVQEFFAELQAWEPEENVPSTDFYLQKCLLYNEALRWVPDGPVGEQALRTYVEFLSACRPQFNNFPEWFVHVQSLTQGYVIAGGTTREWLRAGLKQSSDPFFRLLTRLDKVLVTK
mgnify:CR=1 FL=1